MRWVCPDKRCGKTHDAAPDQRGNAYHACPRAGGLSVPMVREGVAAKLVITERLDWVGREDVQLSDERRPIMSVTTVRDDGTDCTVYAPVAVASVSEG